MSQSTIRAASFVGVIVAIAAATIAQESRDGGENPKLPYYSLAPSKLIWLVTKLAVQKEIGLTETEFQKMLASLREIDPTNLALQTPEERKQRSAALAAISEETARKSEDAIQKSLSDGQFRRFQELQLQSLGSRALVSSQTAQRLARQLALTEEQEGKLKAVQQEFRSERTTEITNKYTDDLLAVLTPEQTIQWKTMIGATFEFPKPFGGPTWKLIFLPEVQKEIGLSEEEFEILAESLATIGNEGIREKGSAAFNSRADQPPKVRIRVEQELINTVSASLTITQWNRLQELILQEAGPESLDHPDVATRLELSSQQRDRVRTLMREFVRESIRATLDAKTPIKWEEKLSRQHKLHTDLLEIVTPDQLKRWEAMQGAKVHKHLLANPGRPIAGQ